MKKLGVSVSSTKLDYRKSIKYILKGYLSRTRAPLAVVASKSKVSEMKKNSCCGPYVGYEYSNKYRDAAHR